MRTLGWGTRPGMPSVVGNSPARSNTIELETYTNRSTAGVERSLDERAGQSVVHRGQRERELVEVRDPADDRGEVDDV